MGFVEKVRDTMKNTVNDTGMDQGILSILKAQHREVAELMDKVCAFEDERALGGAYGAACDRNERGGRGESRPPGGPPGAGAPPHKPPAGRPGPPYLAARRALDYRRPKCRRHPSGGPPPSPARTAR